MSNKLPATQDLGRVYFTSSQTVKTIIEAEGTDSFTWIVRKEFDDPAAAARWEYKVIRRLLKHPKILNKAVSPVNVPGNWFTNGTDNILGKYCPVGYTPGRTYVITDARKMAHLKQRKNRWWYKNHICVFCEISPGPDWLPGRPKTQYINWNGKALKGTGWWNNGLTNYRGNKPPPGYVVGRVAFTRSVKPRPRTLDENKIHSNKMLSKRWWNNGETNAFSEAQPDGYISGRLPFKRHIMPSLAQISDCGIDSRGE
jgi:hypothetical protein